MCKRCHEWFTFDIQYPNKEHKQITYVGYKKKHKGKKRKHKDGYAHSQLNKYLNKDSVTLAALQYHRNYSLVDELRKARERLIETKGLGQ